MGVRTNDVVATKGLKGSTFCVSSRYTTTPFVRFVFVSLKVRMAWHKLTGQRVAVKTYEKAKIKVRGECFVHAGLGTECHAVATDCILFPSLSHNSLP